MSLGITSNYNSLNGLGLITGSTSGYGYGNYGCYGFANEEYVNNVKTSLENGYDVRTTQQSYNNKQTTETMGFNEQCQAIQYMLKQGRSDDALFEFNNMVNEMSELGQYQGYSEKELKTLAQTQYANATGSTLVGDIQEYADSSFGSGVSQAIPIVQLFSQSNSQSDLISEVTSTGKSKNEDALKVTGVVAGGAAFGALTFGAVKGIKAFSKTQAGQDFGKFVMTKCGVPALFAAAGVGLAFAYLGIKSADNNKK